MPIAGWYAPDDGAEARQRWRRVLPACGCRDDRAASKAMLANDVIPVVPAQGSVGASGDLAPLVAYDVAVMIGVGECIHPATGRLPGQGCTCVSHGLEAGRRLAPRKAWRCSTARNSRPPVALAGLFEAETLYQSALVAGALSTDAAQGLRRALRSAHPSVAQASRSDRDGGCLAQSDGRQRHP
ncbi:aromatic amino acid lyase [Mesorhizobium atlanticum]